MDGQKIEIELDGKPMGFDSNLSFGEISDQLKASIGPSRVLTEIYVDGRAIDIDEEANLTSRQVGDLGDLKFASKDVGLLLKDSLQLAPQICEALVLDCEDIEKFFEVGDFTSANERIAELSSLVDWLLQMIASLQSYGAEDFKQTSVGKGSVFDSVNRMDEVLRKLHQYLQNMDYDSFRSLLKEDFQSELSAWREMFVGVEKSWRPRES